MTFAHPHILFGLLTVPLLVWFLWWMQARTRRRLEKFAASDLVATLTATFSPTKYAWKGGFLCVALTALIFAAARPQWGYILEESDGRGVDVLIALDTSRSMLAEDVRPNRLERAKLAVLDLLTELEGNRVGLVAFAGQAFLQVPLTLDFRAFQDALNALEAGIIPAGGTDVAAAIAEAQATFPAGDEAFKFLILITDGEDLEAAGLQQARAAAEEGVRVFTVGVGSVEGTPIPVTTPNGQVQFLRDPNGEVVLSRLDEDTLLTIAAATGGAYAPLGATGEGLREVYAAGREGIPERDLGTRIQQVPIERFHWPLGLALICLVLERLLTTRRKPAAPGSAHLALVAVTLGLMGLIAPNQASAESINTAKRLFKQGEFAASAEAYAAVRASGRDEADVRYNHGVSLFRAQAFGPAADAFRAALETDDPALQERAFFNLGNALFALGNERMTDDPVLARDLWEEAVAAYTNAEGLNAEAEDATRNRALVAAEIRALIRMLVIHEAPGEGGRTRGEGAYVRGQIVEIEAEASDLWRFVAWEGDGVEEPEEAATTVDMSETRELIAMFVRTWQLDVLSADEATGTAGESGRYDENSPVEIVAEAKDYFAFNRWVTTDPDVTIADEAAAETTVTLAGDGTVTALFTDAFLLEVLNQPALGGNVGDTGFFATYTEVPIRAAAREGFTWVGWDGENVQDPTALETTVTLAADTQVTARFQRDFNLIVLPQSDEMGTTTGGGNYPEGTVTPITATAAEGYEFVSWAGPGVADPAAAETFVTVQPGEHDVIAIFEAAENEDQSEEQQDPEEQEQEPNDEQSEDQENAPENSDSDQEPEEQEPSEEQSEAEEQEQEEAESENNEPEPEPEPSEEQPAPQPQPLEAADIAQEEARLLLAPLRENPKVLPQTDRPGEVAPSGQGRDW